MTNPNRDYQDRQTRSLIKARRLKQAKENQIYFTYEDLQSQGKPEHSPFTEQTLKRILK